MEGQVFDWHAGEPDAAYCVRYFLLRDLSSAIILDSIRCKIRSFHARYVFCSFSKCGNYPELSKLVSIQGVFQEL